MRKGKEEGINSATDIPSSLPIDIFHNVCLLISIKKYRLSISVLLISIGDIFFIKKY